MAKAIAIVMMVLSVLALGAAAVISVTSVAAQNCGGPGQLPCDEYCVLHPSAPECRQKPS